MSLKQKRTGRAFVTTDANEMVEVETRIRARPDTIFRFLVDPQQYVRWQGNEAELDPRPGGIYRVAMPDGATARGTYLVIEPPHRIVFTWGWEGDGSLPPGSSTVEITLAEDGGETVVRLRHVGIPSAASRELHAGGWRAFLGRLAAVGEEVQAAIDQEAD